MVEVDSSSDDEMVEVKPVYQPKLPPKPQAAKQTKPKLPRKTPQPTKEYYQESAPQQYPD